MMSADDDRDIPPSGPPGIAPDADPKEWVKYSDQDLDRAERMMADGDSTAVFFFCQQTLEKRIKALIAAQTCGTPPRIHDLPVLARVARLEPGERRLNLLTGLSERYVSHRYPGMGGDFTEEELRELAEEYLAATREAVEWLDHLLK